MIGYEPAGDVAALLAVVLRERYGAGPVRLVAARHGLNPVFRVERHGGAPWYVRAGRAVPRIARALLFLEQRHVAAPRLVAAVDGTPYVQDGDLQIFVMTAVEGDTPRRTPEAMVAVGAALGRLHAIAPVEQIPSLLAGGGIELPAIERAGMLPVGEIAAARSWLLEIGDRVPPKHQAHFDALWEACDTLSMCEGLPIVFTHGDAHYNNTILTPTGQVVYVDFDAAGPGPAVIDLGFLLVNADGGPIVSSPEPRDPACVEAVIRGYSAHASVSELDLGHLADAVRFRPLVWACALFKDAILDGRSPKRWPLDRVRAADELAERAIATFRSLR
jgi:Ser/Thr protein kinase RdoA (MazF antagonist)